MNKFECSLLHHPQHHHACYEHARWLSIEMAQQISEILSKINDFIGLNDANDDTKSNKLCKHSRWVNINNWDQPWNSS